jgi:fibronectin type 3 domain-containing protein
VVGYNVYRGSVTGGPYTEIDSVLNASTNYVDNSVQAGQTYYYVATAVDGSGVESGYSNQVKAAIPTP